jgi:hypothetical protein
LIQAGRLADIEGMGAPKSASFFKFWMVAVRRNSSEAWVDIDVFAREGLHRSDPERRLQARLGLARMLFFERLCLLAPTGNSPSSSFRD